MNTLFAHPTRALTTVPGSLAAAADAAGTSLAESFVACEAVVLVDVSGSMGAQDSRGGRSRYDVALDELAALQAAIPGRIAVIAFSDSPLFVPGGAPPYLGSGTNLTAALQLAKLADVAGVRFVVVSDGQPDNSLTALEVARSFTGRIDVVYVGPEEGARGRAFLDQLAAACGGRATTADRVKNLADTVGQLLLGD
ncbi:MAG: hypothetical protein GX657_07325 [Chloroflexi bacterium]|nr:hypothetical protein [Chloroflexota bacterium]